jgi:hypothetical protein
MMGRAPLLLMALLVGTDPANAEPNKVVADYLRDRIGRCWDRPAGTAGIGAVIIRFKLDRRGRIADTPVLAGHKTDVRIELNDKGEVVSPPRIIATQQDKRRAAVVRHSISAIRKCSPFPGLAKLAPYENWREITLTFEPRGLR